MKIIAIRAAKGCSPQYLKILKTGQLYYFYNDYEINEKDHVSNKKSISDEFYYKHDLSNRLQINISAIVGKNGSGKSSIVELLFRTINNIAATRNKVKTQLNYINKLHVDLYFETGFKIYKCSVRARTIKFYELNKKTDIIDIPVPNFDLKNFFYTIAVNYSHYAYNIDDFKSEGDWLSKLFHKNDGYQTPLVLNPFRNDGNIDISNENHLVKSRLIANLALASENESDHFKSLSEGSKVSFIRLTKREDIENKALYEIIENVAKTGEPEILEQKNITINDIFNDQQKELFLKNLNTLSNFNYNSDTAKQYKHVHDYLIYKIIRIAIKYYANDAIFFQKAKKFNSDKQDKFLKSLITVKSHITLKLRQTLNFLKYNHLDYLNQDIDIDILGERLKKVNSNKKTKDKLEIVELIPPPIFDLEIYLKSNTGNNIFPFSGLSSGEKQIVYSINSFLYHLLNLDSIYSNTASRTAFRYVNIILEEVELYAHPDMQRNYISQILKGIKNLQLKRIRGINFCIVTHSPFVLTDIPNSNILFLTDHGIPLEKEQCPRTFGGNIHDLLADSFFLTKGTIGSFSQNIIDKIIKDLNNSKHVISNQEKLDIYKIIDLIGEPFIRIKLLDMFYSRFDRHKRIIELEEELRKLKQ